jgi:hypothetical protein
VISSCCAIATSGQSGFSIAKEAANGDCTLHQNIGLQKFVVLVCFWQRRSNTKIVCEWLHNFGLKELSFGDSHFGLRITETIDRSSN